MENLLSTSKKNNYNVLNGNANYCRIYKKKKSEFEY